MTTRIFIPPSSPPLGFYCPCSVEAPAPSVAHAMKCCCPIGCRCDRAAKAGLHGLTEREKEVGRLAYAAGFASGARDTIGGTRLPEGN